MEPVARCESGRIRFRLDVPQTSTVLWSAAGKRIKRREVALPLVPEKKRGACARRSRRDVEQLPNRLMLAIRIEPRKLFYLTEAKVYAWGPAREQIFRHRLTPMRAAQRGAQIAALTDSRAENTP